MMSILVNTWQQQTALSKYENKALIQANEEKAAADAIAAFLRYAVVRKRRYETSD